MNKRIRKCPYCGSRVSYLGALAEINYGEHTCPVCDKNSNISYSKRIYIPTAVLLAVALAVAGILFFFKVTTNLLAALVPILVPFAAFYFLTPLYFRLEAIKSEAQRPVIPASEKVSKQRQKQKKSLPENIKNDKVEYNQKERTDVAKKSGSFGSKFSRFVNTYIIVPDEDEAPKEKSPQNVKNEKSKVEESPVLSVKDNTKPKNDNELHDEIIVDEVIPKKTDDDKKIEVTDDKSEVGNVKKPVSLPKINLGDSFPKFSPKLPSKLKKVDSENTKPVIVENSSKNVADIKVEASEEHFPRYHKLTRTQKVDIVYLPESLESIAVDLSAKNNEPNLNSEDTESLISESIDFSLNSDIDAKESSLEEANEFEKEQREIMMFLESKPSEEDEEKFGGEDISSESIELDTSADEESEKKSDENDGWVEYKAEKGDYISVNLNEVSEINGLSAEKRRDYSWLESGLYTEKKQEAAEVADESEEYNTEDSSDGDKEYQKFENSFEYDFNESLPEFDFDESQSSCVSSDEEESEEMIFIEDESADKLKEKSGDTINEELIIKSSNISDFDYESDKNDISDIDNTENCIEPELEKADIKAFDSVSAENIFNSDVEEVLQPIEIIEEENELEEDESFEELEEPVSKDSEDEYYRFDEEEENELEEDESFEELEEPVSNDNEDEYYRFDEEEENEPEEDESFEELEEPVIKDSEDEYYRFDEEEENEPEEDESFEELEEPVSKNSEDEYYRFDEKEENEPEEDESFEELEEPVSKNSEGEYYSFDEDDDGYTEESVQGALEYIPDEEESFVVDYSDDNEDNAVDDVPQEDYSEPMIDLSEFKTKDYDEPCENEESEELQDNQDDSIISDFDENVKQELKKEKSESNTDLQTEKSRYEKKFPNAARAAAEQEKAFERKRKKEEAERKRREALERELPKEQKVLDTVKTGKNSQKGFISGLKNKIVLATEQERNDMFEQEELKRKLNEKEARRRAKEKEKELAEKHKSNSPKKKAQENAPRKVADFEKASEKENRLPKTQRVDKKGSGNKPSAAKEKTIVFEAVRKKPEDEYVEQEQIVLESVKDKVHEFEDKKLTEAEKIMIIAERDNEEKRQAKIERQKAEQERRRAAKQKQLKERQLQNERSERTEELRREQVKKAEKSRNERRKSDEKRDTSNVSLKEVSQVRSTVSQKKKRKKQQLDEYFTD